MNPVSIISLIFSGVMLVVSVVTFIVANARNYKGDTKEHEAELNTLREGIFKANMKLDQVCATTNDIKTDIKSMNKTLNEHGEQIAVIKRDLETAFMRIDELRNEIRGNDHE